MNKSELVEAVASQTGSSTAEARRSVEAVLHQIVSAVATGDRVALTGFGSFEPVARAARTARNPRTGETVEVRAATLPRFHSGAGFRAAVDSGQAPAAPGAPSRSRVVRSARPTTAPPAGVASTSSTTEPAPDDVAAAPSSDKGTRKGAGKAAKKPDKKRATAKAPKKKDAKPAKKAPKGRDAAKPAKPAKPAQGKKAKAAAKGKAKKK